MQSWISFLLRCLRAASFARIARRGSAAPSSKETYTPKGVPKTQEKDHAFKTARITETAK